MKGFSGTNLGFRFSQSPVSVYHGQWLNILVLALVLGASSASGASGCYVVFRFGLGVPLRAVLA